MLMAEIGEFTTRMVLMIAMLAGYYWVAVGRLGQLSRPLAGWTGLGKRYPQRDISAVVNLPVAGIAQAVFAILLIVVTGTSPSSFVEVGLQPVLLIYGVALGIGEMALSTFLCNAGIALALALSPRAEAASQADWLTIAKGGWSRFYLRTIAILPLPAAALTILLYVAGEEVIFRGVLIPYFSPFGDVVAVLAATLLFAAVQTFHMPSWRAAMFPVIGAVVMGVVHGSLFIAVPNLIPLIVAHLIFLIVAIV